MRTLVLILVLATAPIVSADETIADCEEDQPWIGYATSDPAREAVEPVLAKQGLLVEVCEGEQWDGQDGVQSDGSWDCAPVLVPDPNAIHARWCMGADPNAGPEADPLTPLGVRASSANMQEAYVAANVLLVGRVAFYVGACDVDGPGLEGSASCAGSRELRTGLYVRDNTPGNLIAEFTGPCFFSVIPECGMAMESDCSQAVYQQSAYHPPSICARDNTALGVQLILP